MARHSIFYFSLLAIFLFFTSCASTSKADAEKSDAAKSFTSAEGKGTVYLYRTGRAVGAAGSTQVRVNGQTAGGTGPSTFFKWDLKPGTYTFSASTAESSAVVEINAKAGEQYFIRLDDRMGIANGRVTLKKVSDDKGKKEVKSCKLLVSAYVPE